MERFIVGHNADPSNWREGLELLAPRCLEIFVPPRYCEGSGLFELRSAFEQMARHPNAKNLEFASCHFPWGESANGYSRYNLIDDQYFSPFLEIARAFYGFCRELDLPPERSAVNFHNLYELPRSLLDALKREGKLAEMRETLLAHAYAQTQTAKRTLEILDLPLTLTNENNPPLGDGDRMSIVDVFADDLDRRATALGTCTCMDLSHFFMTKFYYDLKPHDRPSFPYLEVECEGLQDFPDFEAFLEKMRPLYFHVSDTKAPGTSRTFEGLPVGTGDTPWTEALAALGRYASRRDSKLFLIIEIKGGHTADGIKHCSSSERELRGFIEDCFTSGFLKAISKKESAP